MEKQSKSKEHLPVTQYNIKLNVTASYTTSVHASTSEEAINKAINSLYTSDPCLDELEVVSTTIKYEFLV